MATPGPSRAVYRSRGRARSAAHPSVPRSAQRAFTLIELLIVVAIIALLVSILMPALGHARRQARIVTAHSDLRQIGLALERYMMDHQEALPPTRSACGTDVNNQLPVELAEGGYLPRSRTAIPQADFRDVFHPNETYKYRAPGPIWQNGSFFDFPESLWRPRAQIWVPEDFPFCESDEGTFFALRPDEPPCPIRFAIWSVGPDPESRKFPRNEHTGQVDRARFPLQRNIWLHGAGDTGLIVHARSRLGHTHTSP